MTGIVIAAGRGLRLAPYTDSWPKCMLPIVGGRTMLSLAIERLRAAGCDRLVVVTGHLAERIDAPGCHTVHNDQFADNNILHSLMYARAYFDDDLLVTYSDIVAEPAAYTRTVGHGGDIVLAIDRDWRSYYDGRTQHPISEAEKAVVRPVSSQAGRVEHIGKHLPDAAPDGALCGEFLGLFRLSRSGATRFRAHFETLDAALGATQHPFQQAREWRKAYVTDFFTELMNQGETVECALIERGWAEVDAVQDYERLPEMLKTQRLYSLMSEETQP